ncbi:MAG: NAD(P)H-dependent glycerol-3-phosphate dehydrogenase [Candidatus Ancillula sp.]|jgi:glycerol-3-phosphate dehydrogenase (NAD(P)+)|nr:NAD(P)H-dependent glycerol-3-phosphate dehydrogenase [Candidatus Ancillula sp.]
MADVAILGSGMWGTTLGKVLVESGQNVKIWGIESEIVGEINKHHSYEGRLPGIELPKKLTATTEIKDVLGAKFFILAIAAQHARSALLNLLPQFEQKWGKDRQKWPVFISVMKGMEQSTGKMMGEMIAEVLEIDKVKVACIAGPNLALEVAKRMPASTTVAASSIEVAESVAELFANSEYFDAEVSDDIKGVELLSCLKNVYALAAGYYSGQGYGSSTIATIITRALKESTELLKAVGGKRDTILTYAGLGDMIATCCSPLSRNHSFGFKLGQGLSVLQASESSNGVSEGVPTVEVVVKLANLLGVKMPIAQEVLGFVK